MFKIKSPMNKSPKICVAHNFWKFTKKNSTKTYKIEIKLCYIFYDDLGEVPEPFGGVGAPPELFDPGPKLVSIPSLF